MEAVPADIIEEILVRLPVKSLLRFKCVCRSWRALTENRRFIHRHYNHDSNQERLLFLRGEYAEGRILEGSDYNPLRSTYFDEDKSCRMGAVNGLFCEVSESGGIVLLNPATHQAKRVPPLPFVLECSIYGLLLRFGLDPLSGDCDIIVINRGAPQFVCVYNSSSDCWKRVNVHVVGFRSLINRYTSCMKATFSNGVYYWLALHLDGSIHYVLAFDMMSEKLREITVPDGVTVRFANIAAYGDSIALMSVPHNGYEFWVMRKPGIWSKRWSKSWRFSHRGWLLPLCVWKNEIWLWDFKGRHYNLVDMPTGKVKIVEVVQQPYTHRNPHPFSYKESLV